MLCSCAGLLVLSNWVHPYIDICLSKIQLARHRKFQSHTSNKKWEETQLDTKFNKMVRMLIVKRTNCRIGVWSEMLENKVDGEDHCYSCKASCSNEDWLMKLSVYVCIGWDKLWCHYSSIFHSQHSRTWRDALCCDLMCDYSTWDILLQKCKHQTLDDKLSSKNCKLKCDSHQHNPVNSTIVSILVLKIGLQGDQNPRRTYIHLAN